MLHLASPSASMQTMEAAGLISTTFARHILTNDLLFDLILWFSTPATMLCLSRVCRLSHAAVRSHVARRFNVNKHLSRCFASPEAFRALQERTGALISGSTALQFFDRTYYDGADLDVYCAYSARAEVGWWLIERAGYTFRPNHLQHPDFALALDQARSPDTQFVDDRYGDHNGISAVYSFTRRVVEEDSGSKEVEVQIIVAYESPMSAILCFHSTAVLNIISYSHAYSLYPRATFENRLALLLLPDRRVRPSVKEKYEDRGYTLLHEVPMLLPPLTRDGTNGAAARRRDRDRSVARCFALGFRWIGDRHSWVLPLRADGAALLPPVHGEGGDAISRDPCAATTWEMELEGELGRQIRAESFEPAGFGQNYVVTVPQVRDAMMAIRKLYANVPRLAYRANRYCHEELMRWCKRMLQDERVWEKWYPAGSAHL